MADFKQKRLEQFHDSIKPCCASQPSFHKGFRVDRAHIARGAEKDGSSLRSNIGDEQIAAVIMQGKLNLAASQVNGTRSEIAVEGKFTSFVWLDIQGEASSEMVVEKVEPVLCVRVIVREGGGRYHFIVTTYVPQWERIDAASLPEVQYEIW